MNISPNKLVIRRLLKNDRAQVFSALTDPAKMAKWFLRNGNWSGQGDPLTFVPAVISNL